MITGDAGRTLTAAIETTLDALDRAGSLTDMDTGAARLVRKYGAELDQVAAIDRHASKVLAAVDEQAPGDVDLHDAVAALRSKLASRTALTTLGARLETLLDALGATPAGRAKQGKRTGDAGVGMNALAKLRSAGRPA